MEDKSESAYGRRVPPGEWVGGALDAGPSSRERGNYPSAPTPEARPGLECLTAHLKRLSYRTNILRRISARSDVSSSFRERIDGMCRLYGSTALSAPRSDSDSGSQMDMPHWSQLSACPPPTLDFQSIKIPRRIETPRSCSPPPLVYRHPSLHQASRHPRDLLLGRQDSQSTSKGQIAQYGTTATHPPCSSTTLSPRRTSSAAYVHRRHGGRAMPVVSGGSVTAPGLAFDQARRF